MAWIEKEKVKNIKDLLKKEFPNYKFSVTGSNSSEVTIKLLVSDLDFHIDCVKYEFNCTLRDLQNFNDRLKGMVKGCFSIKEHFLLEQYQGKTLEVFNKIFKIAKSQNWFDNSERMEGYIDISYYINVGVGTMEKRHIHLNEKIRKVD